MISAGERVAALTIGDEAAYRNFRSELGKRFCIEICYCSTLDECWIYSDRTQGVRAGSTPAGQCSLVADADAFND